LSERTDNDVHVTKYCVRADHPSLPGHFPGQPVVPAVLLLNHVVDCVQYRCGDNLHLKGIESAKFLAPLLPDQEVTITISMHAGHVRFKIERGATAIAQGSLLFSADSHS
jgi:3-hydroxymyristoyl/3-hydroxydecanoyl-(acyl carrier protein) dehydratase